MKIEDIRQQLEVLHPASFEWSLVCSAGDRGLAEEALQTTYVKVLQGVARYGGDSTLKTWLFAVIRNTTRELRRRRLLRRALLLRLASERRTNGHAPSARQGPPNASVVRLQQALATLSQRQQQVLHLVYYQEMTVAEAGAAMGVSVGSARTHYERGKARLRKLLANNPMDIEDARSAPRR